jgi:hypothetical protein
MMWDADARKVGIQRVGKRDPRAYTVRYARKFAWCGFAAKSFLARIEYDYSETTAYPAEWDKTEEMFVFCLPQQNKVQVTQPQQVTKKERQVARTPYDPSAKVRANATA